MGSKSKANHGTTMEVMVRVLHYIQMDAEAAEDLEVANELWKLGAYLAVSTAASLRDTEAFMMDLAGMWQHVDTGREGVVPPNINKSTILSEQQCLNLPHVAICLYGKYKGETVFDHHVINVANETQSGLRPRFWVEALLGVCRSEGRMAGPAFADRTGKLATSLEYDVGFRNYMERVQRDTTLIPKDWDVRAMYGIHRTPRKTAQTRIKRAGFGVTFQQVFNRWRGVERAGVRRVRRPMHDYYAEATLLMPTTWLGAYVL
ncbi:hypothetical protein ACHAWF_013693 [Thalassiosira exigua]